MPTAWAQAGVGCRTSKGNSRTSRAAMSGLCAMAGQHGARLRGAGQVEVRIEGEGFLDQCTTSRGINSPICPIVGTLCVMAAFVGHQRACLRGAGQVKVGIEGEGLLDQRPASRNAGRQLDGTGVIQKPRVGCA